MKSEKPELLPSTRSKRKKYLRAYMYYKYGKNKLTELLLDYEYSENSTAIHWLRNVIYDLLYSGQSKEKILEIASKHFSKPLDESESNRNNHYSVRYRFIRNKIKLRILKHYRENNAQWWEIVCPLKDALMKNISTYIDWWIQTNK